MNTGEANKPESGQLLRLAESQLQRVLGLFSRVDSALSVVLGVDLGMFGFLAVNAPPARSFHWLMGISLIPIVFLVASLWHIYHGFFPRLEGAQRSLLYFREIAKRTETKFIDEFRSQTEDTMTREFLSQVWQTSEILGKKYDHLKWALIMLSFSIVPWLITLAVFAAKAADPKGLFAN